MKKSEIGWEEIERKNEKGWGTRRKGDKGREWERKTGRKEGRKAGKGEEALFYYITRRTKQIHIAIIPFKGKTV